MKAYVHFALVYKHHIYTFNKYIHHEKNFNNTTGTINLEKVTLTHKFMLSPTNGRNIKKYYDYLMLIFPTTTLRVGKERQISKKRTNEL